MPSHCHTSANSAPWYSQKCQACHLAVLHTCSLRVSASMLGGSPTSPREPGVEMLHGVQPTASIICQMWA